MPKRRRKRRTEAQWSEILQRFESSRVGPREFCRREGLSLSSLQRWRGRTDRAPAAEFVELVPATPPGTPAANWALELSLPNGMCLRLRG
jgi:hypothetical protein